MALGVSLCIYRNRSLCPKHLFFLLHRGCVTHLLAVCDLDNDLTSLSLSLLICKIKKDAKSLGKWISPTYVKWLETQLVLNECLLCDKVRTLRMTRRRAGSLPKKSLGFQTWRTSWIFKRVNSGDRSPFFWVWQRLKPGLWQRRIRHTLTLKRQEAIVKRSPSQPRLHRVQGKGVKWLCFHFAVLPRGFENPQGLICCSLSKHLM